MVGIGKERLQKSTVVMQRIRFRPHVQLPDEGVKADAIYNIMVAVSIFSCLSPLKP